MATPAPSDPASPEAPARSSLNCTHFRFLFSLRHFTTPPSLWDKIRISQPVLYSIYLSGFITTNWLHVGWNEFINLPLHTQCLYNAWHGCSKIFIGWTKITFSLFISVPGLKPSCLCSHNVLWLACPSFAMFNGKTNSYFLGISYSTIPYWELTTSSDVLIAS